MAKLELDDECPNCGYARIRRDVWQPIETLNENQVVLLYQPANEEYFRSEGMIVGSIEREGWEKRDPPFWITSFMVSGYEFECDMTHPTYWMPLPAAPSNAKLPDMPPSIGGGNSPQT